MSKIDISKGRYWDRPWSLVDGCTPCSPGCDHCWSAAMAHRFKTTIRLNKANGQWVGCAVFTNEKGKFNGQIRIRHDRLDIPLRTRKPTVWAVWNDLFHESVQNEFIFSAFSVMAQARDQTFLVLTKRAERMAERFAEWEKTGLTLREGYRAVLPNVYHGLTVCNQAEADKKIPVFLQVPGRKFLSIEPMLGPVDLMNIKAKSGWMNPLHGTSQYVSSGQPVIDAVILGGETGPGARPMNPDWVRGVRDQCAAAGVPFFFKSWGAYSDATILKPVRPISKDPGSFFVGGDRRAWMWDDGSVSLKTKAAGRVLDGRTHDDLPWVKP